MLAVLQGLGTIGAVVGVGYLLARLGILPEGTPQVLSRLVFFVATPALLLRTLAAAPVDAVLSGGLVVTAAATAVGAAAYALVARFVLHAAPGPTVIGALSSSYVNAGNLGIPLAVYVLGDAALIAPVMLYQLVVLAPLAFVLLDAAEAGRRPSWRRVLLQPVRNPILICSIVGIVLALTGTAVPTALDAPLALIAGMAVPGALLAFGLSLRGAPRPGRGGSAGELLTLTVIKVVLLPAVAFAIAKLLVGLDGVPLLAATLGAALPTAQNVFVYAVRYGVGVPLARDAVSTTTLACIPVLIGIAALLG